MNGEEKSGVDKLREKLYSRTRYQEPTGERSPVEPDADVPETAEKWDSPELDEMLKQERRQPEPYPVMKKFFLFALVFFVGAAAVTAFIFLAGSNFVSSKNVDISLVGPTNISAGDTLELAITISNKNNADLRVANLSVQYPQGSHNPDNPEQPLTYVREEIGAVGAGREVERTARAILFGEEGEVKQVKITVEYQITGSNATFYKDKVYEIAIGDAPLSVVISQPESINSGDSFTTELEITSASEEVLRRVVVKAEYPPGYTHISSEPEAVGDNSFWALGDMPPGTKKTLTLQGRLIGENEEERTFRFNVGVGESGLSGTVLGTTLVTVSETVGIARPSISLSMSLDGDMSFDYSSSAGESVEGRINFQNNLSDRIVNPRLTVRLSGQPLNEASVNPAQGGQYDPQTNTVTWNIMSNSGTSELLPGATGEATLRFESLPSTSGQIDITATLTGQSIGAGQNQIQQSVERVVRVSAQPVEETESED